MYDVSTTNKRYFDVKMSAEFEDGEIHEIKISVLPPKIKNLRLLTDTVKDVDTSGMDELQQALKKIFSSNKDNYKVPDEYIDELDTDQLIELLMAYFNWVGEIRKN